MGRKTFAKTGRKFFLPDETFLCIHPIPSVAASRKSPVAASTQKTAAGISLRLFSQNGFPFIRLWVSDPNYRLTLMTVTAPAIATIPRTAKIRIPASPGLDGVDEVEAALLLLDSTSDGSEEDSSGSTGAGST